MKMPYSIVILRGTRMHRFVVSRRALRYSAVALVVTILASGWFVTEYLAVENEKLNTVISTTELQRAKLSALRERARALQEVFSSWKAASDKLRLALPRRDKEVSRGQYEGKELEEILSEIHRELNQMIAGFPSKWPLEGKVVSGVGLRPSPWTGETEFHSGLDIPRPTGTPVHASGNAVVETIDRLRGTIVLNHGQEIKTQYSHLSKVLVAPGDSVHEGQTIGHVGSTGKSTGPHLHYEVRIRGIPIDPRQALLSSAKQ